MKRFKYLSLISAISLFFVACKTEMVEKLDDFNLEQGGYMRTVNFAVYDAAVSSVPEAVTRAKISKANMAGTKLESILEAVTPDKGALFSSYDLTVKFVDATPANGNKSTSEVTLRSIPASAYSKDATTGYPRHTLIITGADVLTATKLTAADVSAGDRFEINATMKLTNGKAFNAANTGPDITGGAFYSSPFFYRLNVAN